MTEKTCNKCLPGQEGFTLLEVLIAVALSSVIMIGLFNMFDSVVSVSSHIKKRENVAYQGRTLESIMFEDLGSLYPSAGEDFSFYGYSGSFLGEDGKVMSFCTSASLESSEISRMLSLQRVEYLLKTGSDTRDLFRREKQHCGVLGDWDWVEVPIARGVAEIDVEYLDPFDNSFVTEWGPEKGFPTAVRVTIRYEELATSVFVVHLSSTVQEQE